MTNIKIAEALALADKGVQRDDGFNYLVPSADLVAYAETIRGLAAMIPTEQELRQKISNAIGYAPVPLSIRDHPEITFEHRTAADRDHLVDRISAALMVDR